MMGAYKLPWILPESERMKCVCADCKAPYDASYDTFEDMVIPNDLWLKISPFEDGAGLLCPTCMANRLHYIGKWYQTGFYLLKEKPFGEDIA